MYGLKELLIKEQKHLEGIISLLSENKSTAPEGRLRISMDGRKVRYYHCTNDNYGEYIPRENAQLPCQLAQKAYDETVLKAARVRHKLISKCLKGYRDDEIEQLYDSLHIERQKLVVPVEPTFEQLEEKWYSEAHTGKPFHEGTPVIFTEKGERVRSKSEKILADYFYRNNIHYKYEKPLTFADDRTVYPDFTFFSKRSGKEIFWEHEGMMDKPEYARAAVKKISSYQMNGIYPGERLILTFETEQNVLDFRIVEELVDRFLC